MNAERKPTTGLADYNKLRGAIERATDITEVLEIRDKVEAVRKFVKARGEKLEAQNMLAEARILAEHKVGLMLGKMNKNKGGRPSRNPSDDASGLHDLGITYDQSSRWQLLSGMNKADLARRLAELKAAGKELTTDAMLREERRIRRERSVQDGEDVPLPDGTFRTIVIDPPWPMQKIDREVRPAQAQSEYKQHRMTLDDIKALDVPAADLCHLYLWTTHKMLPASFDILRAWGFKYTFEMVWHKAGGFQPFNLPQYNCEFVLFGRKGGLAFSTTKAFPCCFDGERREHSSKPDEFYDLVRRVSPAPRIDMFSRRTHQGFKAWGDEAGKFDGKGQGKLAVGQRAGGNTAAPGGEADE